MLATGRVGSAFAAELGTMQVSEQTDSLRVLGTDPVDYLVSPRVLACMIAAPILNIMCFAMGESADFAPMSHLLTYSGPFGLMRCLVCCSMQHQRTLSSLLLALCCQGCARRTPAHCSWCQT